MADFQRRGMAQINFSMINKKPRVFTRDFFLQIRKHRFIAYYVKPVVYVSIDF